MYSFLHKLKISHTISKNYLTTGFAPFRLFYWLLSKVNLHWRVSRKNRSLIIPIVNGVGLMNLIGNYENWLDDLLHKLLEQQEGIFIDVGANTGQTLLKIKPYFNDLMYYAVEPNTHCVKYLKKLCSANHFFNVKIVDLALSDRQGETELLLRYPDDILATTSPSFRKFTRYSFTQKVKMSIGDEWMKSTNIASIAVIKIDVEGGESGVLKGFQQTITQYRPIIICEILPLASKSKEVQAFRERSANSIISLLDSIGYRIFNIVDKNRIQTIEDLSHSLESANYLCVSSEVDVDAFL